MCKPYLANGNGFHALLDLFLGERWSDPGSQGPVTHLASSCCFSGTFSISEKRIAGLPPLVWMKLSGMCCLVPSPYTLYTWRSFPYKTLLLRSVVTQLLHDPWPGPQSAVLSRVPVTTETSHSLSVTLIETPGLCGVPKVRSKLSENKHLSISSGRLDLNNRASILKGNICFVASWFPSGGFLKGKHALGQHFASTWSHDNSSQQQKL